MFDGLTLEVKEFRCSNFVLRDDLRKIYALPQDEVPEATILYCSRILEALAAEALRLLGAPNAYGVFQNLESLRDLDLFSPSVFQWAHALRRIGNEVRHLRCRIEVDDAVLACVLLERWLEWFFCSFPWGPRVRSLTQDGSALGLTDYDDLSMMLRQFENPAFDPQSLADGLVSGTGLFAIRCPGLFSLVAEMLLDRQKHSLAESILVAGIKRFPYDPRLLQLRGLLHSHLGLLDEALRYLEPLRARFHDDIETASILAGALKRKWWANPSAATDLHRAHKIYRSAWERSGKQNAYLGTNAATTALWLGDLTGARRLASSVRECLVARHSLVTQLSPEHDLFVNYWAMVSLAEAEVLLGNYDRAVPIYRTVFSRHPTRKQNIQGTKKQLGLILRDVMSHGSDVDSFLDSIPT